MTQAAPPNARRPGRPSKVMASRLETRAVLVRSGTEILTEKSLHRSGLDEVLCRGGVPTGSSCHGFDGKVGGRVVVDENR